MLVGCACQEAGSRDIDSVEKRLRVSRTFAGSRSETIATL